MFTHGKIFMSFLPGMSDKAVKRVKEEVNAWKLQLKVYKHINDIANMFNAKIQGWINYYGRFYKSELKCIIFANWRTYKQSMEKKFPLGKKETSMRRRKSLAVCTDCHYKIHKGEYNGKSIRKSAGEPRV
jgi:RNA-directed DNA polymerase